MVSIAGVLAMRPDLVIYDEPSASLDMRSRRRLIRFLQAAPQTLLLSSHDLELVLEVCDRVILLDEGQIVANGSPAEIMGDVSLMEAHGLERPHSLAPHLAANHVHHVAATGDVDA
jgi:cobalt/nickel transport system ATP-binding protein